MGIDLSKIGMKKGQQYETIITTVDANDLRNAAPIGVICKGKNKIMCRIFKGSKTLENIIKTKEFTVNITYDPLVFTYSTIENIPENQFNENNSLKNADSYFKCEVISLKEAVKKSDPIRKSEANVIIAEVKELVINKPCSIAMNRGMDMLIESLINYTRINDKNKDYFLNRFQEAKRVINKVGSNKEKKAISEIKKALIQKGFLD